MPTMAPDQCFGLPADARPQKDFGSIRGARDLGGSLPVTLIDNFFTKLPGLKASKRHRPDRFAWRRTSQDCDGNLQAFVAAHSTAARRAWLQAEQHFSTRSFPALKDRTFRFLVVASVLICFHCRFYYSFTNLYLNESF